MKVVVAGGKLQGVEASYLAHKAGWDVILVDKLGPELDNWVIQEYLEGPSFSIEVIGFQGSCKSLQVTDLEMDHIFDCKRVHAPTVLSTELEQQFGELAVQIGELIGLTGIMDVEVIKYTCRT